MSDPNSTDEALDTGLQLIRAATAIIMNAVRVSENIRIQRAEGRPQTAEELAAEQNLTKQKIALLEIS